MSGFSPAFDRLGAAHAAIMAQRQESLAEFLPDAEWSADLSAGAYTQGGVTLRIALLGSFAEENRTWLWGWANPQFGPEHPAVTPAMHTRELGARLDIPELTAPEIDLSWYAGPARNGGEVIAMATSGLLDAAEPPWAGVLPGPYAGGVAYFGVHDPAVPVPRWDPITAPRVIINAVGLFPADHRLTVMGFLSHHGIPYRENASSISGTLPDGGSCTAEFDARGRFTGLSVDVAAR